MRTVFVIAGLLLSNLAVDARIFAFESGTSPSHRYRVQVAEGGKPSAITYDFIRARDGGRVHRIYSSYQKDRGELPDWSWNHATEAAVAWSPKSRYVSIDEQVHRYEGEVFFAEFRPTGVRDIKFPTEAILRATKGAWDRHRVRHERGWISDDCISLRFAGKPSNSDRYISYLEVILRLKAGTATVVSCHEITQ